MRNIGTETKVGIFVVLGIIALTYFTVRVGNIPIREMGYRVSAQVESAAGLVKNSPVRIAGVEVGKVESIVLDGTKAKVTLQLPKNVKFPAGSKVYVKSAGLLGEKYVDVAPGPGPEFVKSRRAGGKKAGRPWMWTGFLPVERHRGGHPGCYPFPEKRLWRGKGEKSIQEMVANTEEIMANLRKYHPNHRERGRHFRQTGQGREGLSGSARNGGKPEADGLQPESGRFVRGKGGRNSRQAREGRNPLQRSQRNGNQPEPGGKVHRKGRGNPGQTGYGRNPLHQTKETMEEAKQTLSALNKISQQIEKGEGTLGKLVKDDALYTQTKETMEEAKQTLAALNKVSEQIEKGEGTLGKLVKDETLYEDTRRTVKCGNQGGRRTR